MKLKTLGSGKISFDSEKVDRNIPFEEMLKNHSDHLYVETMEGESKPLVGSLQKLIENGEVF